MNDALVVGHAAAKELAGLYMLDALERCFGRRFRNTSARVPDAHLEFDERGSVLPALALLAEPLDAPGTLRARVMAAIESSRLKGGQPTPNTSDLGIRAGLIELAAGDHGAGRVLIEAALALYPTASPLVIDEARRAVGQ